MEEEEEDAEGLRVLHGACRQFWVGTQAAEEAAAAAAAAAVAASTAGPAAAAAAASTSAAAFPANRLPLAAAMMLDRWSLLLHPDQPSCITPQVSHSSPKRLVGLPAAHHDGSLLPCISHHYHHHHQTQMMARKAMLLHKASESPSLRQEVRKNESKKPASK
jgi:hypothetical protein